MGTALLDWPSGGPTIWLAKWEELISQSIRYDEPLRTWLRDVCLVWERVPELSNYFSTVQTSIDELDTDKYTPASISAMIQRRWEHKKQDSTSRVANKPRATRSAFTARGVTLNGEEAPDASDNPDATAAGAAITEKPKAPSKRKHKSQNEDSDRTTNKRKRDPCTACGGLSHNFSKCYLALGQESDLITDEARGKFQNNMKAASFRKRVSDLKKTLPSESNADE